MPRQKMPAVVDIPYVLDSNVRHLLYILAIVEAISAGRAPLFVCGRPEEDWARAGEASLSADGYGRAVDLLSGAQARTAELSILCRRVLDRITVFIEEETSRYFGEGP